MASPVQLRAALLQHTSLSESDLAQAMKKQEQSGRRLTDLLLELELVPEGELIGALAAMYGIPTRETLAPEDIDAELATQLPISFAKHHHVLPIRRDGDRLEVAIADPLLTDPLDDVRMVFAGARCEPVLVTRRAILNCINHVYDQASSAEDVAEEFAETDLADIASELISEPEDLLDSSEESAPIIRLVNSLLQQAVKERASDIHIQPGEKDLVVRFRIDNLLHEPIRPLPRRMQQAITTRIKIMGRLDIAEKRLPQDGRIVLKIAGRDYDVRLSTLPTQYGERCVLRLLPRTQELLSIEKIGLSPGHQETLRKLIRRNNGIILVTGPTGSGKTNTLYAALADINKPDQNIITIEDPVEIRLPGISQIEVKSAIGLTFAAGLRSILRQNPNVILIGEIRDLETAEIAIQASLTGHLVFSTLHTNEAAGTITRLIDMGVEPFLIASSLVAAIGQRLIRVLCKRCREPYAPGDEELAELSLSRAKIAGKTIYRAKGCVHCNHTGYHGRTGIFEILPIDETIRPMITRGVDSKQIQDAALAAGMQTMRMHGARMVLEGTTSIAEIVRQTEEEAVAALDPQAA
ncbi:MAG: type II secretion system protein GspE [Deltaproteobacteria bacterium]|nr:type II secretion system protein GspE [Deltaproteobacteria bacterium]